jgi:hypothetical protein
MALRVVVFGGHRYPAADEARRKALVWRALDLLHRRHGICAVIQGAADGVDRWAAEWGWAFRDRGEPPMPVCSFAADWDAHGKAAGPMRNRRMILEGRPDVGVGFPGERGSRDMGEACADYFVRVWWPLGPPDTWPQP